MVHHGAALERETGRALTEAVASGKFNELGERVAGLCRYALKLTLAPSEMERADVDALRAVGLTDRDIVDANQVASYFNYVNRVADGLGVELEAYWPAELRKKRRYGWADRA